jgi:hypothetical protein
VLFLLSNEGYGDPRKARLCKEAIRLARALAVLMPDEPEAQGMLAPSPVRSERWFGVLGAGVLTFPLLDHFLERDAFATPRRPSAFRVTVARRRCGESAGSTG